MQQSPLAAALSRLQFMAPDVWDYREDLNNLAKHLCSDPDDAEDVAHSALLKAMESMDTFRGPRSVRQWLHRITSAECKALRRRQLPSPIDVYFDDTFEGRDPTSSVDPQDLAVELELRRDIIDALSALPDNYRCALLLKDGNGMTVEATAQLMGVSVPAARSVIYRARQALRASVQSRR